MKGAFEYISDDVLGLSSLWERLAGSAPVVLLAGL